MHTEDFRFAVSAKGQEFSFLRINSLPAWTASEYKVSQNTSFDGGLTFKTTQKQVLFGAYFFLSDSRETHHRVAKNVLALISELGGFFSSVIVIFSIIGNTINRRLFLTKVIEDLYFKETENEIKVSSMKIKATDTFSDLKLPFKKCF